jgi:hypothetical protein
MKAIAISTLTGKCLPVLLASIEQYVPTDVELYINGSELKSSKHKTHNFMEFPGSFGEAYNFICNKAFESHDEIIVANDDVVIDPTSYERIVEATRKIQDMNIKTGWVVAKSYRVRGTHQVVQNAEMAIYEMPVISPLFGRVSKESWVDFPPINWYSDDIQCIDMGKKGYRHFVSHSYIHHVGSQTIGQDNNKNHLDAEPWIKANRPELHKEWFK